MEYKIFTSIGMLSIDVPMHAKSDGSGERYLICPICSSSRKPEHRSELKFAVNIQENAWRCNHCQEGGYLHLDKDIEDRVKPLMHRPVTKDVSEGIYTYFNSRKISRTTVDFFRVKEASRKILQIHNKNDALRGTWVTRSCISFPLINDGKLINVQYRDQDKNFSMESKAEKILFNVDSIKRKDVKRAVITEGYIDCMSYHEAGMREVVSVPNGSTISKREMEEFKATGKLVHEKPMNLTYLDPHIDEFDKMNEVIIATDDDAAGIKLREELARRIGKDKCRYVKFSIWKNDKGEPCKDGNDVLKFHGPKELLRSLETAEYFPVQEIISADQVYDELMANYDKPFVKGLPTGFPSLEPHFSWHLGHSVAINGYPTMGKTSWILYCFVYFAVVYKWKSICYTPENYPVEQVFETLIEIYIGKSAKQNSMDRMNIQEYQRGAAFIKDNIYLIEDKTDEGYNLKKLLSIFSNAIKRYGVRVCSFDPWNSLDHRREAHYNIDDYLKKRLSNINRFATNNNVLFLMGVHPPTPEKTSTKIYNAPSMFDIEGGGAWSKKMYEIMCFHRASDEFGNFSVEVHIQKIKHHKITGVPTPRDSPVILYYNPRSNRFEDKEEFDPLGDALKDKSEQIEIEF